MKRILLVLVLLSAPLLLTALPATQAQTSGSTGISGPQWIKSTVCYGPNFTTDPNEYVKTETDIFNLTYQGTYLPPGVGLNCGPVGTGSFAHGWKPYPVSPTAPNSTDLHWYEANWITPKTVGAPPTIPLNQLLQNVTEKMYVNGRLFVNFSGNYNSAFPNAWWGVLDCSPSAYSWSFNIDVNVTFTHLGTQLASQDLSCGSSNPTPAHSPIPISVPFDDFHLYKHLNATYTSANQPSSLRKVTDLNGKPIDRTYLDYHNPVTPPSSCDGVLPFNQYIVPPPIAGDLGMGLSQDPVWAVQGGSMIFPLYLQLLPNNPPIIIGDSLLIDAEANIPVPPVPALPAGISLSFNGLPAVSAPNLGPTTIPALTSNIIQLKVSAAAVTPQGVYTYFLNVTDQTTGKFATWGIARIAICPAVTTSRGITPIELLLTGGVLGLLLVAERRIRAAGTLARVRPTSRS